jgi:hypothetical protein
MRKKNFSIESFAQRLRKLLKFEEQEDSSKKEWQKLSREFVDFVRSDQSALDLMEEELWHYTEDFDIRKKDREYAFRQRDYVLRYIEKIEGKLDGTLSY